VALPAATLKAIVERNPVQQPQRVGMAINHLEEADLLHHHPISCEFLRPACRRGA